MPDENFWALLSNESEKVSGYYRFFKTMISSIKPPTDKAATINSDFRYLSIDDGTIVVPSLDNLYFRERDSEDSGKLGIVFNIPHTVIEKGKKEILNGIMGTWLKVLPFNEEKTG